MGLEGGRLDVATKQASKATSVSST